MRLRVRTVLGNVLRSKRAAITISAVVTSLAATVVLTYATFSASALSANMRIDPSTQVVAPGADFSISLVENADIDLSGVQADIQFDPSRFQVVSLDKGTDWGTASMFVGGPTSDGHPQTLAEALAEANTTGVLRGLARFKSPGSGRVLPGSHVAAIIHMHALAGAADGQTPVNLSSLVATDGNFNEIPTSKTNGAIVVSSDATPTPTSVATATGSATATPAAGDTATATPAGATTETATASPTATDTPGPGVPGTIRVSPQMQSVQNGMGFTASVIYNVDTITVGVLTDISFDPALVQIVDVAPGSSYLGADMTLGSPPQTNAAAIAEANSTGTLKVLFYFSDGNVSPGDAEAFKLHMQAKLNASGISPIQLKNSTVYGGVAISVTRIDGMVEVIGPATATSTVTATRTATATSTATPTAAAATSTATNTPPPQATATNTVQGAATPTRTVAPAPTGTSTVAALSTNTPQVIPTDTPAPTSTATVGAAPTATTGAGTATATVKPSATSTKTVVAGSPTVKPTVDPSTAQASISTTPPTVTVPPGAEFTMILVQQAPFVTTGAQTDVQFDPKLLQIVSVEKSAAYAKASLLAGVAPQKLPEAIAEANSTGTLKNLAAFFVPGSGSIPAGPAEFVRIKMKAKSDASNTVTLMKLAELEMLNATGETVTVAAGKDAQVTLQVGAPVPTPPGASSTVAGASTTPSKLPSAGVSQPFGQLNWALTISLIAMLASGGALIGSLARKEP